MARRKRERFLGRSIGAGAFGDPRDGDGDGFYSPRQGMPDKTPVPRKVPVPLRAEGMPIIDGSEGKLSPQSLQDRSRRAAAKAKDIETKVLKKHGNIRNRETALTALNKTFPNLGSVPRMEPDLFDEDDGRNSELSDSEYNFMVALLHSGELSPSAARRLVKISNKDGDPISGGSLYGGVRWETMEWSGMHLSLNRNVTIEEIRQIDTSNMAFPVAYQIAQTMDEMGTFSDDEINRVLQQNLAFHEMGHAMHWDYGLTHFGIEPEDNYSFLPIELAKDGVVDGIHNFLKIPRKTLEDAWDQYFKKAKEIDPDGEDFEFSEIATMRLIQSAAKSWEKQIGDTLSDEEIFALEDSALDGIAARITWDGTPEAKRDAIRRALASVSIYSENGMDDNHGVSYMEGTAESIALRLSDPDGNLGLPSEASEMLNSIDAIKSKQLAKVALESISADDLIQMGEELEQNPDKRFRTRLPELTNDRYGFNPPRTSKPFGSKSKGSTTKKDFYEVDIESKILGIGIGGRRGRSGRGGRRFKPVDGDGDGFYSPRPGMPDKTPVVVQPVVALGEGAFGGGSESERALRVASETAKAIEKSVTDKFGPLKTQRQVHEALHKAFPKAKRADIATFAAANSDSDVLPVSRNFAIGLLHGSMLKPKTAKRITSVGAMTREDKQNPDLRNASGFCATGIQLADRRLAVLRIALDLDIRSRSLEELHSPGEPWATRISKEMKRSGQYSDEDIDRFLQINVALHEYGHAMHTDAGLSHWGATDTKIPIEPYIATGASWFQISEQELRDAINARKRNKIEFFSDDEDDQTAEVIMELVTASAIQRQYDPARARQMWANKLTDTLNWDGVTDRNKRSQIVRELGKVSGYASTSYSEAVAESVARREGSSGAVYSVDREAQRHLRYVYTKQEKMKKEEEPITMVNICSGYLRKGPDGKLVPIPKPKKEKTPVFTLPKE